jgi:hypothetical protein
MRYSPLAVFNILLVALILAVGLPGIFADAVRLPSEVTIHELQSGQPVAQAADETAMRRLGWAAMTSNVAHVDLALAMLADATDPVSTEYRVAGDHAARQLRTYLAAAPGDSRAWANLALAEMRRDTRGAAVIPFKMSVELAPTSAVDLVWRCGFGIDLYPALDDDGRAMLARQFRLAMDDGLDGSIPEQVVRLTLGKRALPLVWGFIADDPVARARLESLLARKE